MKHLKESAVTTAIRSTLPITSLLAVAFCAPATAQPASKSPAPKTLQEVIVTGSHIRRVDVETDNPISVVSAQRLQQLGVVTLGEAVQQLPSVAGGILNPTVNNSGGPGVGGSGATLVGLRGLGASRTLILVDGQRVINNDLNSIPISAVERIEVLKSGASSIYGTDAIGGVINFILKSKYTGAQFTTNYGISDHNDGSRKGGSFLFGTASDKGSILAGVSYQAIEPILQSARDFSKDNLSTIGSVDGKPAFRQGGSSFAPRGFISVPPAISKKFGCDTGGALSLNATAFESGTSPTTDSDYHCFGTEPNDRYNFNTVNYLQTPQDRTNAFFNGVYHLSDNVDVYATLYHDKTTSRAQAAPALFGTSQVGSLTVSKDSYYNPFGIDFSPLTGGSLNLRTTPIGNRVLGYGSTTDQLIAGFRGKVRLFGSTWSWDLGMDYGHTSVVRTIENYPNVAALVPGIATPSMLDPATGQVVCVSTPGDLDAIVPGCQPWDPFDLNSRSAQTVMGAAGAPSAVDTWQIERIYHASMNGGLVELPAGTVELAVGVDHRKEYLNNVVGMATELNPVTHTCILGSNCTAHLQGGFHVNEAYAELFIPILQGAPFAYGLNATLADRYSKYSTFAGTSNWKVGVEWRPIRDLLVRGTVAKVFRAPTISDMFAAPTNTAPFLSFDPCDYAGSGLNPNASNAACAGVPEHGPFVNQNVANSTQLLGLNEGSRAARFPLGPETGKSFDFGVVYSPSFLSGLTATIDFWRIYLTNTISSVGAQNVLSQCFAGASEFCPLIERVLSGSNSGQIIRVIQPTANLGRIDVRGTDLSVQYNLPRLPLGQVSVVLNSTYMSQYKIQTAPGGARSNDVLEGAGVEGYFGSPLGSVCPSNSSRMCFFPRVSSQAEVNWALGPWSAGWTLHWTSPFRMDGSQGETAVEGLNRFGSYVYNDFYVGYTVEPINTSVKVGVNNVFDKQPPLFGSNRSINSNTDPSVFDPVGRYYWAKVVVSF